MNGSPSVTRINGRLWVSFDDHIDLKRLEGLEPEIAKGIALAGHLAEPLSTTTVESQYDKSVVETTVWMLENPNDPELLDLKNSGATFRQQFDFVRFRHKTVVFGEKIMLRSLENYAGGFARKHIGRLNTDREAYKYFPGLKSFIEDSNIFKDIGRTLIFMSSPKAGVEIHSDYADRKTRRDQFIWLNIKGQKKFFVLDENDQKDYIIGNCCVFDNANWHGADPVQGSSFTVRVDGSFTDEWMHKTGIYEHFSKGRKS